MTEITLEERAIPVKLKFIHAPIIGNQGIHELVEIMKREDWNKYKSHMGELILALIRRLQVAENIEQASFEARCEFNWVTPLPLDKVDEASSSSSNSDDDQMEWIPVA